MDAYAISSSMGIIVSSSKDCCGLNKLMCEKVKMLYYYANMSIILLIMTQLKIKTKNFYLFLKWSPITLYIYTLSMLNYLVRLGKLMLDVFV